MKKIIYEIIICLLAIISVILAIIDMSNGLSQWMAMLDNLIYAFFVLDYIIRFFYAKRKRDFFKHNIFDLIAIIPVSSIFRIFRTFKVFRLLKLAKLTKLTRIFTALGRLFAHCKRFLNTNGFKYMLIAAGTLILIGGILISFFEDMTLSDGIWWSFVTTTTVGYGDISPSSTAGRATACVLMIMGIGLIGSLTSTITTFFMKDKNDNASSERVNMVLTLYRELNDSEKECFKKHIIE